MQRFNMPSIDAVQKVKAGAREHISIFDGLEDLHAVASDLLSRGKIQMHDASSWNDKTSTAQAIAMLKTGDVSRVANSDKLLEGLEQFLHIETTRFKIVDDVAGAVPNVPAYLAGQPLSMRRRQRTSDDQAPLTVFVDTTSSAGISTYNLARRGAAVLAFLRTMATRRPIKLYATVTLGLREVNNGKDAFRLLIPIESAPIDLARAAYVLTHAALPRALGYPVIQALAGLSGNTSGPWPYCDVNLARAHEQATYAALFGGDIFNITAPHGHDQSLDDPRQWLIDNLTKYGMNQNAEAA